MDRTVPDWHAIDGPAEPSERPRTTRVDPILMAVVLIVVLATVTVLGIGWLLVVSSPSPELALEELGQPTTDAITQDRGTLAAPGASPAERPVASPSLTLVVVDVEGAVTRPGVYRLASDSRVGDAIAAAGGYATTVDAFIASMTLNLAERLVDGAKIRVPVRGEAPPAPATSPVGSGGQPDAGAQPTTAGLVDLNHATREELEALPGVGSRHGIGDHRRSGAGTVHIGRRASGSGDRRREDVRETPPAGDRGPVSRGAWLAVGAILAALAGTEAGPAALVPIAAGGLLLSVLTARRMGPAAIAFTLGAGLVALRLCLDLATATPPQVLEHPAEGAWSGVIGTISAPRDGEQRAVILLDEAGTGGPLRVYGTLPRYPIVLAGDRVAVAGRLRPPPPDGGFGAYLRRAGIGAVLDARSLAREAGTRPLERVRAAVDERIASVLPEPQAGLASALLVGLRERVDRGVADAFTVAGISHVVAISGWNICLVAGLVATLARRLPRRPRSLLIVVTVALYTILAGASASVVRAALMAAAALIARESGRRGRASAVLGVAATAMLLVDPAAIGDPGYRLSVAATAGLLAWGRSLTSWLAERLPRLPAWLAEALGISLAAQAATLPLVLLDFGRLSLVAPATNLVVAPLVAPAMAAAGLGAVAGIGIAAGVPAVVGGLVALVGWALLGVMIGIASVAAALPLASVEIPTPARGAAAVVVASALVALGTARGRAALGGLRRLSRRRPGLPAPSGRWAAGSTALDASRRRASGTADRRHIERWALRAGILVATGAMATLALVGASRPEARLRMTVLDVGQGDAILLEGPRGGRILVDGGPDPDRLLIELDRRLPPWDRRLDLFILTHPHEDHVGGLALLLTRYRVGAIGEPGMRGPGPGYRAFAATLADLGLEPRFIRAGQRLRLDGVRIDVRWPPAGGVPVEPPDDGTGINNVSVVLDIRFGARRLLMNGDVEEGVDPRLIGEGSLGPVDVLKVAHHGSRTSSTAGFLAVVRPRIAIVSAGRGNRYGHPAPEAIERLQAVGARVLRTDENGSVTVSTDGRDLRYETTGARPQRTAGRSRPAEGTVSIAVLFLCDVPADPLGAPRIARWPSPAVARRQPSFSSSTRRRGSSRTSRPSPRSPPSSLAG